MSSSANLSNASKHLIWIVHSLKNPWECPWENVHESKAWLPARTEKDSQFMVVDAKTISLPLVLFLCQTVLVCQNGILQPKDFAVSIFTLILKLIISEHVNLPLKINQWYESLFPGNRIARRRFLSRGPFAHVHVYLLSVVPKILSIHNKTLFSYHSIPVFLLSLQAFIIFSPTLSLHTIISSSSAAGSYPHLPPTKFMFCCHSIWSLVAISIS